MNFKLYKDSKNNVYSYPIDGSQDNFIGDKTPITQKEFDDINIQRLKDMNMEPVPNYIIQRTKAYPSMMDFADAWVKNDEVALEKYRQDCLAVKSKYPKE
jgi:hypothetical protein